MVNKLLFVFFLRYATKTLGLVKGNIFVVEQLVEKYI